MKSTHLACVLVWACVHACVHGHESIPIKDCVYTCVCLCLSLHVGTCCTRASALLPVHKTLRTTAEQPGTNGHPSNSDACLPSDPLTGRVRSPAQRVLAAITAAEAGPGDHGRHRNAGRGVGVGVWAGRGDVELLTY